MHEQVRSVYARGMLAYFDASGNKTILDFLVSAFSNYTATDSTSDRSLTQIEALLEGHAYGGWVVPPAAFPSTVLAFVCVFLHSMRVPLANSVSSDQ
jgi:hypothetical protein